MASGTSIGLRRAATAQLSDRERAEWDRRASRLYEDLRRPAIGLVRRAYGQAFADDEIEDIYSSAWLGTLRALARRHSDLADDEIRSYLLTAVANHASKELRRRKRKPIAPIEAAGAVADLGDTPEDSAAASESSQVTRDLLASLPPRRRAVMLLRYGWGLNPSEVCGMVKGLSPRAYRKEVTRGVDELTAKIKLVEEGRWCEEREPLLKTYAAGLADADEALQAEHHLAHCRPCHEFVGKLTGHLHDLGSAVLVPGALDAIRIEPGLLERVGGTAERTREAVVGAVSRSDSAEAAATLASARGAGAAGAGIAAKLAGLGAAGTAALACLGGGAAATACLAAGLAPFSAGESDSHAARAAVERKSAAPAVAGPPRDSAPPQIPQGSPGGTGEIPDPRAASSNPEPTSTSPVTPDTPPEEQEWGVASAATPAPSAPAYSSPTGSDLTEAAVQQEFGP